jgi:hypothetical protein
MKQIKVNAMAYGQLIKFMLEGIYTCQELAEMTGLHYVTVLHYTRELHRARACHIVSWEKDGRGRDAVKIYKIGQAKDARRERMTPAERQARLRLKRKAMRLNTLLAGGL